METVDDDRESLDLEWYLDIGNGYVLGWVVALAGHSAESVLGCEASVQL